MQELKIDVRPLRAGGQAPPRSARPLIWRKTGSLNSARSADSKDWKQKKERSQSGPPSRPLQIFSAVFSLRPGN